MTSASPGLPDGAGLRAVIFDMDGVLIDTEPVWRRVEIDVFASLGLRLTEAECRETMGVRIDEVVQLWYERRPWSGASVDQVAHRILAGVIDHVRAHGVAIDGAFDAVAAVRDAGLLCAVASSSPPALIEAVVEKLDLGAHVDAICSAEQEARGKPAPDVYLRAAALLGLQPANCLAIEDSVNGVLSARAAGMPCAVIPDSLTAADPRLAAASLRLASLGDINRRSLEALSAAYFA